MTQSDGDLQLRLARASMLLDRDARAAALVAGDILATHPGHGAASLLLATALSAMGDDARSLQVLTELATAAPDSAVLQLELGRVRSRQGDMAASIEALTRAVQAEPRLADGWRELSRALSRAGEEAGCDAAYARFAALTAPVSWLLEPSMALREGREAAAESLLRRLLTLHAEDPATLAALGLAVARRDGFAEAQRLLERSLVLEPGFSEARLDLVRLLLRQQKVAAALPHLERLLRFNAEAADIRRLWAVVLSMTGRHAAAVAELHALLAAAASNATLWLSLGHEYKAKGDSAAAVAAYRRAASLDPPGGAAYWSLANLKTAQLSTADIETLRAGLERSDLNPEERVSLEFALGKALEDRGSYAESFAHYEAGNRQKRQLIPYDPGGTTRLVQQACETLTPAFFAERRGHGIDSDEPIFIVGLPRSGSTLLEQILASHSTVEGTRELPDVMALARELGGDERDLDGPAYVQALVRMDAAQSRRLALRYLEGARPHRLLGRTRFIDKMPNNFLHVGLIHLMFPRASIIDARRGPLACGLSCFKQLFGQGQSFTYDLGSIGWFYRDYLRLMGHVQAVLPERVLTVCYEQVIEDLESSVRRLLAYCGLAYEERCLRFHENARAVRTASAQQVRRPIFAEGVDHWRHFEPWLGPLRQALSEPPAADVKKPPGN